MDTAKELAHKLIKQTPAACVNILSPMTSVYEWEGNVQEESEIPLLIKACKTAFEEVETAIKSAHPYDTPCIISFNTDNVSSDFDKWILDGR